MPLGTDKPRGRNLRRGRYSEAGRAYLVTSVTWERQPWFDDFGIACAVARRINIEDANGACETLAWVLMPDHLHWLFVLGDESLSSLVARFKQVSALEVNRLMGRSGGVVWQRGYHDHAVRQEEDLVEIARYVVANPLRAGLVERLVDYPFWDAVWL